VAVQTAGAAGAVRRWSRRAAVRDAALAAFASAAGIELANAGSAVAATPAPSPRQDAAIFNFALLLEYLQSEFYRRAVEGGRLRGDVGRFAEVVADHEAAHVAFLRKALGAHARARPNFAFGEATRNERKFLDAAVLLENTGVLAYNGQAANLTKPALAAAAEIVSVEGRHAAWISDLAGVPPAPRAADVGVPATEALKTLRRAGLWRTR
jgi:hypothetical protein